MSVAVIVAFEKLFKMLLGLALLAEPLLPIKPPMCEVPDTEPVEKVLVINPEFFPTKPPMVPYMSVPALLVTE